ncbi:cytochrome c-type biogenesis protein [Pseudemcibacter aquimaris]|uniref:cytochrome c-type biogenesis protein n=1 Tax=Pseudemcibacter aquimaris TaxID=2857064 RepID=UPI00201294C1|nr:cytochrome c-type biogenesis protein [Pseudemcibacter aquimaris]MCC3861956.1 cytochrome c-type biogenesis protein CcmH [Pseudemcibacter aquimaris]WDU58707.1 cytochrome c-type biogenesis protein CcmH [Pseudemcibacter aquimaris]
MRMFASLILWIMMSLTVLAVGVDEKRLANPADEARAQEIMKQLRCLVCQNQSVVDSDAGLAKDIRIIVRERVALGEDEATVLKYMTDRYGDWVLLKPPFDGATVILWLSPALLVLIGFFLVYRNMKSRKLAAVAPLSDDEKARLDALLNDGGKE